jgi:hypothetical protein
VEIVAGVGLWVWDKVLPDLVVSETTKVLLESELEELEYEVAVEVSSMLLRVEGVGDGSRTTTLEEVTEDAGADSDNSTISELLLLEESGVAVGNAEPSPSTSAVDASAVDAMLSVELGGSRVDELAETPDCVNWNAELVWLAKLSTTAELTGTLLLLLLPTIAVETVVVAILAEEALGNSGKPAASVEALDTSKRVLVKLVEFAVRTGAITVGVSLPSTTSAVEEETVELPATLKTEYDVSPGTLAETLEGVGGSRVLLWDAPFSFLTEVEAFIKLVPLLPSTVEEAEDVYMLEVLVGATSRFEAAAEEVASGVPTGEATTLLITAEELPSTFKYTEDEEVVGMLAGVTFSQETDAEGVASGVSIGEATLLDIAADTLLDIWLYVEKMLVAKVAIAVGLASGILTGEATPLDPADMLLDCHRWLYIEEILVAGVANAVGVASGVLAGKTTSLSIPADALLDCHCWLDIERALVTELADVVGITWSVTVTLDIVVGAVVCVSDWSCWRDIDDVLEEYAWDGDAVQEDATLENWAFEACDETATSDIIVELELLLMVLAPEVDNIGAMIGDALADGRRAERLDDAELAIELYIDSVEDIDVILEDCGAPMGVCDAVVDLSIVTDTENALLLPPRSVSNADATLDDADPSTLEELGEDVVIEEDTSLFCEGRAVEDWGMVDVTAAMVVEVVDVFEKASGASDELVPLRNDSSWRGNIGYLPPVACVLCVSAIVHKTLETATTASFTLTYLVFSPCH